MASATFNRRGLAMSKRSKGSKRYQPAPWSDDFDALKRGGVAPFHRKKKPGGKPGWGSYGGRPSRGGGR
jgi:hypothetical protein